jgi:hypothetical protein
MANPLKLDTFGEYGHASVAADGEGKAMAATAKKEARMVVAPARLAGSIGISGYFTTSNPQTIVTLLG